MHQSDPDPRPDLPEPTVRPGGAVRLPSFLSDIDLTDHKQRLQSRQRGDISPDMSDDSELQGAAATKIATTIPDYRASSSLR